MVKEGKKPQQSKPKNNPPQSIQIKSLPLQKLLPNTSAQMFRIWNKGSHLPVWEIIMCKSFMIKTGRQNVFFLNGFSFLTVWGTIALNMLLHQKAPHFFNLYSFKSYLFKRISLCYSYTLFVQENKSHSMKGV